MSRRGRALTDPIETQAGISFVERPSGWKGPCPFEEDKAGDSFIVFNLKDGEFFCLSCKAKGGMEEFDRLWSKAQSSGKKPAPKQPAGAPPAPKKEPQVLGAAETTPQSAVVPPSQDKTITVAALEIL